MDAPARRLDRQAVRASWHNLPSSWTALLSVSLVLLLFGCALLLVLRRWAGALSQPLSAPWLLLVGFCIACVVIAARRITGKQTLRDTPTWIRQTIQWGPTWAVAMFAIALSIEGTSLIALSAFLILIVGSELFAEQGLVPKSWLTVWPRQNFWPGKRNRPATSKKTTSTSQPAPPPADKGKSLLNNLLHQEVETDQKSYKKFEDDDLEVEVDEKVWQQMSRLRTPEGEVITGWVKSEFQPGERTAVLHVAFCPPLLKVPSVQIEQLSGPAARIKVGQVLPQGARFEIRLNTPGIKAETLLLEFVALEQDKEMS